MTKEAQPAVAVSGASTGIGKTIALALDANGFRVFARLARLPVRLRDSLVRRFMSSGVAGQAREVDPKKRRFAA